MNLPGCIYVKNNSKIIRINGWRLIRDCVTQSYFWMHDDGRQSENAYQTIDAATKYMLDNINKPLAKATKQKQEKVCQKRK